MNYRVTTILLALTLLLVAGVPATQAAPAASVSLANGYAATAGDYDFTMHGTAWVREVYTFFKVFNPKGWGMATQAKAAGSAWVHIPIPYPSRIADSTMKIKYVEFCAKSTNGASTKPVQMDLWEAGGTKFLSVAVAWPAVNTYQCYGYTFSTPAWHQDLGMSLYLTYANATDAITLYKAWVRITP